MIPLLLPFIQLPTDYGLPVDPSLFAYIPTVENLESSLWVKYTVASNPIGIDTHNFLADCYMIGIGLLLLRFSYNLLKISALKYDNKLITSTSELKIFRISSSLPFSFFNQIFIPNQVLDTPDFEKVIAHEQNMSTKNILMTDC